MLSIGLQRYITRVTSFAGATAMHALDEGFRMTLVDDACRGVIPEQIETLKQNIMKTNGVIVTSSQVRGERAR